MIKVSLTPQWIEGNKNSLTKNSLRNAIVEYVSYLKMLESTLLLFHLEKYSLNVVQAWFPDLHNSAILHKGTDSMILYS